MCSDEYQTDNEYLRLKCVCVFFFFCISLTFLLEFKTTKSVMNVCTSINSLLVHMKLHSLAAAEVSELDTAPHAEHHLLFQLVVFVTPQRSAVDLQSS